MSKDRPGLADAKCPHGAGPRVLGADQRPKPGAATTPKGSFVYAQRTTVSTGSGLTPEQQHRVATNLKLARWCVRRFAPFVRFGSHDHEDAVSTAMLGLVRAARKFDPAHGVPFGVYAVRWCQAFLAEWQRAYQRRGFRFVAGPVRLASLDATAQPDGPPLIQALSGRAPDVDARIDGAAVAAACAGLPPRQRTLMRLLFGEGRTLQEAGDRLGVTRERTRQIRDAALSQLRAQFGVLMR
jgi:RNA polymerase sigma factor (sigma-70 family)